MIKQFENLTSEERALLFKAPVLVSVLASCSYNGINQTKKRDAIKLAHLKTFTAVPLLLPYYAEVEKHFTEWFEATAQTYFPFDEEKRAQLEKEIANVHRVIRKLEPQYAQAMETSLRRYANHVQRSAHSVFQDFIFPLQIPGLND